MSKQLKKWTLFANAAFGADGSGAGDGTDLSYRNPQAWPKPTTYRRPEPKPFSKKARKKVKAAGRKAFLGHLPNKHERKLLYRYAAHVRNYIIKKQQEQA